MCVSSPISHTVIIGRLWSTIHASQVTHNTPRTILKAVSITIAQMRCEWRYVTLFGIGRNEIGLLFTQIRMVPHVWMRKRRGRQPTPMPREKAFGVAIERGPVIYISLISVHTSGYFFHKIFFSGNFWLNYCAIE